MSDMIAFDLVCPAESLASGKAKSVQIPSARGQMTIGAGHEAVIAALKPGFVVAEMEGGESRFLVTHGFAEISASGVSVIAEEGYPEAVVNRELLEALRRDAEKSREHAKDEEARQSHDASVSDLTHLIDVMS